MRTSRLPSVAGCYVYDRFVIHAKTDSSAIVKYVFDGSYYIVARPSFQQVLFVHCYLPVTLITEKLHSFSPSKI